MKTAKISAFVFLIFLVFAFAGCNNSSTGVGDSPENGGTGVISPINVIMINDNHGILHEDNRNMDKIASGIDLYASLGGVIKIANGDMFQGTYVSSSLRGLPMLDALNAMDFDAFVIGNHEFDWGFDVIKQYKDGDPSNGEAEFPFLGANIYDKKTGKMVDWLEPYTIVQLGDIKIGIIGIIGNIESSIIASNVENYDFVDARDIVKDLAYELKADKECDAVIVAAHGDDDELNATLASYVGFSRIDGIFTAHTHTPTDEEIPRDDGSSVCVLQNGGYGESFARLTLEFNESGILTDTDGNLMNTDHFDSEGILSTVFEKYEEHTAIGEEVLLTSGEELSRYEVGISVAHSMFVKYNADFAVINSGGVRTSIDAGAVTYADIFQVLPFENEVYVVTLSGKQLRSYLDKSNGIYYWGIDKNSIVDSQSYKLAIVDYVYLGYSFNGYRNNSCVDTNELVRDVFIEWIKSGA